MRSFNRSNDQQRPFSLERGIQPQAAASILIKTGNTHVLCGVSVEENVPPFLRNSGRGWITAEYGMLPCATNSRFRRETKGQGGRTMEIQRLIGRSLRMMVDLQTIGERTLRVDCDVINADGGTRTASITGASIAINDALLGLVEQGLLAQMPKVMPVTAISAGIVDGEICLDLDYSEDSRAQTDANFVMGGLGESARWIEMGATAEGKPFDDEETFHMMALARKGCMELASLWD
ncbi:ribonuclease PH [Desulforhopalus vacuolatus]|uniref:ribonuclease PH n=1 Tax=Desulforhopalus vacuolatus TaxID=40414 RepID=UPI0019669AEC|nr:ribonuclease PH [Desulforhopalus vacuolatus]MBM9519585.1 ribonuclease PH [Desulforhopalus vacuolatus]